MSRGHTPAPLPVGMPAQFTTRSGNELGLSRGRMRAGDLDRRIWGVRSTEPIDGLKARCSALLARLPPSAFISHVSALALHGVPVPARFDRDPRVDVAVPAPARAPHAHGIRGHRLTDCAVQTIGTIRVSSAGSAWVESGMLLQVAELVAAGDRLIRGPQPLATRQELSALIASRPGHLAGRRLSAASELLDGAAESYQESILRVMLIEAGFPVPEVNRSVRLPGRTVRPDLSYPSRRIAIEYQGDHHRGREQWLDDMQRRLALEAAGWTVIEVTSRDLRDLRVLFARLRSLLSA